MLEMSSIRTKQDKRKLFENATMLISDNENVQLASDEVTGENDFKYERSPNVCAVVVDEGSGFGYAQITGGGKDPTIIYIGRGTTGYKWAEISVGQSCMLYGCPTVLYVRPRS
ncbi:hypothetical protein BDV32DRAFT_123687 [Aspergillus pseudonomiae]|uniref:Uncharacterized protein n=1 Tax=Aspergillus pseudonomiae TaxID=1506151 RepID=A0A5N6I2J6_9EURO|nr:uncharacterized protein BDV37DRAFT_240067 [Aspergillus pseudonomiae]KAB8259940.1 hypothetical protein BDV32DRAFT_123687 [Aspergillus pseudonomiae]KAE8407773.1 hypothetical protein BDV37DRAFT_240067 [Aspergillus pseudonomiae]